MHRTGGTPARTSSNGTVTRAPIRVSLPVRHEKTKAHSIYTAKMIGILTEDFGTNSGLKAHALSLREKGGVSREFRGPVYLAGKIITSSFAFTSS